MQKLVFVCAMFVALAAAPAFAHCGSCGVGEADAHASEASASEASAQDIVAVASSAGTFNTLVAAVKAAGLVETLQGDGPFTVFAPTDDAFAALPEGTLEGLLADTDKLRQVLLYHVVSGRVTAEEVVKLDSATTVQGSDVTIMVKDGTVMVNDAEVITADVMASNGVIHVINKVIVPAG